MNTISKNQISDNVWKIRIGCADSIVNWTPSEVNAATNQGELDLIIISNKKGDYGIIENVSIEEEYREKGLATELLEKTLEICKSMNLYKVVLTCSGPMISFYSERGFEWQADGQAFCMRADLK